MPATDDGERDLSALLKTLSPKLIAGEFVFCTCTESDLPGLLSLSPRVMVQEEEGVTLVLDRDKAAEAGFSCAPPMRCITLAVHSSLQAVGLTAAVSAALAQAGISANVVAGYYHDHIYVPTAQAERAVQTLAALQG
ncbi:MAG: ACT domain-containing protein [Halioglobus sp.]